MPRFLDRLDWANIVDPDQTAPDQHLHCWLFFLHLLDALYCGRTSQFDF